jgi:hypothetical protein
MECNTKSEFFSTGTFTPETTLGMSAKTSQTLISLCPLRSGAVGLRLAALRLRFP